MNKNIKEAIDERRVHHQLHPNNQAEIEEGFNKVILNSKILRLYIFLFFTENISKIIKLI